MPDAERHPLAEFPTPIEPLARLTRSLGGPRLWIKRDDLTGLGLGGNNVRKLEWILPEALRAGCDTLVTLGALQSNHVRITAAAARRAGMACEAVVFPAAGGSQEGGNLILDRLLGARLHTTPFPFPEATPERIRREVDAVLSGIRARGGRPHFLPAGGADAAGVLGYARAAREIHEQEEHLGIRFGTVVTAVGTGGTLAGLALGAGRFGCGWRILGVSAAPEGAMRQIGVAPIEELVRAGADRAGWPAVAAPGGWEIDYGQVGEGYGLPTPASEAALRRVAETEGIFLDPVYTAKAMAGWIAAVTGGRVGAGEEVLFVHTGGAPALFAAPPGARS